MQSEERLLSERLCEDIHELKWNWNLSHNESTKTNSFPDKVKIIVEMFKVIMQS